MGRTIPSTYPCHYIVNNDDDWKLTAPVSMKELKDIISIFMNIYSVLGPNEMSENIYYSHCDIIKTNILLMVLDSIAGNPIPKAFIHTCLT